MRDPEPPEQPENRDNADNAAHAEPSVRGGGSEQSGVDAPGESEVTSLYVRRSRTPTLGFWVALALIAPALVALLGAPFFQFADISGVLNFMLVAVVFLGLPLAAIAALVDSLRHRRRPKRRR